MATTHIPSPPACELYVEMALLAQDDHLSLEQTLTLAMSRPGGDYLEVGELVASGWIEDASDGGWKIRHQ